MNVIHIARGKKLVTLDMKEAPDDDALADYLLGPTGNLRAPTIRKGKTLYVGFSEEAYQELVSALRRARSHRGSLAVSRTESVV